MAKVIKMDTVKLSGDMTRVSDHIENIRSRMNELEEQATALGGMWVGPGSDAFRAAFCADLVSLETVLKNLENLNKYEEKALKKFERCGNKVRSAIEEIRV